MGVPSVLILGASFGVEELKSPILVVVCVELGNGCVYCVFDFSRAMLQLCRYKRLWSKVNCPGGDLSGLNFMMSTGRARYLQIAVP
jgi:hypothetical protein